jgi:hypothetical protein
MMSLTAVDVAVLAGANGIFLWLLKVSIEKRLDLTVHTRLEEVKADLSVRVAFSKLVAEKRFEVLLDLWSATRKLSTDLWKPEDEALRAVSEHVKVTSAVDILLPQTTIDAVAHYRTQLINFVMKGDDRHEAVHDVERADVEFREHLREVMGAVGATTERGGSTHGARRPWRQLPRRRRPPGDQ